MENKIFPKLGYGLGFRPAHFSHIKEHNPNVDWFEIITENYMDTGGKPRRMLDELKERYPIVMHGVSLSIGTVDPLNSEYLQKLKALEQDVKPQWISDHLCWTGIAHKNTHDLLPVPYTEEALANIIERIKRVQDFMGRRIVLENPSTYLEFTSSSMSEWEFIARMVEGSGCGLLLDVNNIYVSCYNHRWDPKTYIDAMPLNDVAQIHLAGHCNKGTHIIDTHDDHVLDEVWTLYAYVINKGGAMTTMVEWDDNIPDFPVVMEELNKARHWATQAQGPTPMPHFTNYRDNMRPPENAREYSQELGDMQNAILSADGSIMEPDLRIIPKPDFSPQEQIQSYIDGYRYRLFDIVYDDFPALRHAMGDQAINDLIDAYIEATPSTSFNICRYINDFPAFVRENADPFCYELAVLETTLSQIFDAEETEALTQEDMQGIDPEGFMAQNLNGRKALKLLAFNYPVNAYYNAYLNDENPSLPQKSPSFLCVFRHHDEMWRLDLEEREHLILSSLFAGLPVGEALEAVIGDDDGAAEEVMSHVGLWFSRWMNNGLLAKAI